jgi:hypothetical protein
MRSTAAAWLTPDETYLRSSPKNHLNWGFLDHIRGTGTQERSFKGLITREGNLSNQEVTVSNQSLAQAEAGGQATGQGQARVQLLTAEVRTLVVGARQVALSVYAQLDECPPELIEPFGRVRPREAGRWHTYVVGRIYGELVRSSVLSMRAWQQGKRISYGETAQLDVGTVRYMIPYNVERQDTLAALATEWEKLPLIVLAGLQLPGTNGARDSLPSRLPCGGIVADS